MFSIYGLAAVGGLVLLAAGADAQAVTKKPSTPARRAAAPQRTASVEGDVYLVMQNGDVKKGAGRTIYLLEDTDEFRGAHARACAAHKVAYAAADARSDLMQDSLMTALQTPGITLNPWYDALSKRRDAASDSLFATFRRGEASVKVVLAAAKGTEAGTGMNAHYEFKGVKPGKYILFGEWKVGDNDYQWWKPIALEPGQALKQDLDNEAEANNQVYCGIK